MICPPNKLIWWKQFPWALKSVQDGVIEGAWWRAAVLLAMQSCWGENLHHRDRQSNLPGPYSELAESSGQAFSLISVFVQDVFSVYAMLVMLTWGKHVSSTNLRCERADCPTQKPLSWPIRGVAQWKSKLGAVTKHIFKRNIVENVSEFNTMIHTK